MLWERSLIFLALYTKCQPFLLCQYIPPSSKMVTLVMKFSNNCVTLSCFGSTISCFLLYDEGISQGTNTAQTIAAQNSETKVKGCMDGSPKTVKQGSTYAAKHGKNVCSNNTYIPSPYVHGIVA